MKETFVKEVEHAVKLAHRRRYNEMGDAPLVRQLSAQLSQRLESLSESSQTYIGNALHRLLIEAIEFLKPPGEEEDLSDPEWKAHVFLWHHVALGETATQIADYGRIALGRAAVYNARSAAIRRLALLLWRWEQQAAKSPVRHNLPHPLYAHYVPRMDGQGRDLVDIIINVLHHDRTWIVSVCGAAGIGKTTLLRETAERCFQQRLYDSIVWTSAQRVAFYPPDRVVKLPDPITSVDSILDIMGVTLGRRDAKEASTTAERMSAISDALRKSKCLLIVDNLETLDVKTQDAIFGFLSSQNFPAPSKALVAGRQKDYPGPVMIDVPEMGQEEALQLIDTVARARGISPLTREDALQVFRATKGIPLAIQQAVGLTQVFGMSMREATGDSTWQHEMLSYMYEGAYRRLLPEERKILHAISVLRSSVSVEAIRAATSIFDQHLYASLARLFKTFLVHQVDGSGRYDILPLLRDFLQSLEASTDSSLLGQPIPEFVSAARTGLAAYYASALTERNISDRLAFLKTERPNVLELMTWCYATQGHKQLTDLMDAMGYSLGILGYWKARRTWAKRAIASCQAIGRHELGEWFKVHDLAWAYLQVDQLSQAEDIIRAALDTARQQGYERVEALALRNLGRLLAERGQVTEGIKLIEAALALWRTIGDPLWLGHTLRVLAKLRGWQGDYQGASDCLEEALPLLREACSADGESGALSDLSLVAAKLGESGRALELSKESLALSETLEGPAPPHAYALWRQVQLHSDLGMEQDSIGQRMAEVIQTYKAAGARYWAEQARSWADNHL